MVYDVAAFPVYSVPIAMFGIILCSKYLKEQLIISHM